LPGDVAAAVALSWWDVGSGMTQSTRSEQPLNITGEDDAAERIAGGAAVRVGVVGAGLMGALHCRILAGSVAGAELAAVADADVARAAAAADAARRAVVHENPYDLIADSGVDAVVVASSDATHEELVHACLRAGKPVLCEKPLAPAPDAALRIVEAEAAIGRRLIHVGFMRRHDPGYVALRDAVRSGRIGAPLMVHCVHRNASAPDDYTTAMMMTSTLTHEIDATRWLLGQEIAAVSVHSPRASRLAHPGLSDPQLVLLETTEGVLVDVEVFVTTQYGYEIRCEVVGESGTLTLPQPARVAVRAGGHAAREIDEDYRTRFVDAYREELQAWAAAARNGRAVGASAWDGYVAAVVADACVHSVRTGARTEVAPAPRPALYDAEPFAAGAR
jgi:myo-inositol 2-dehydrogenase / D-chiro-inositol 1-dehydrogenase